jgi:ArsR family transcriptional regulator
MNENDERERRAARFKALGDPTRLRIFDFLRGCCCPVAVEETGAVRPVQGPTVGEVCCNVTGADRITSVVSHHIKELRLAGLITVERRGKNMICGVNREAVAQLAAYLGDESNAPENTPGGGNCCEN